VTYEPAGLSNEQHESEREGGDKRGGGETEKKDP